MQSHRVAVLVFSFAFNHPRHPSGKFIGLPNAGRLSLPSSLWWRTEPSDMGPGVLGRRRHRGTSMTELDPEVADEAPSADTITPYDNISSPTSACWTPMPRAPIGARWRESSCIAILWPSRSAAGAAGGASAAGQMDDRAWLPPPAGRPVSAGNAPSSVTYALPARDWDAATRESKSPLSH